MSDRHSALSFVTDRTIGTKIAAGFTVVLLFLAVSSGIAYVAFGRVASAVDTYAGLVTRSATYRDIDLKMAQYRGHVREYFYSDDQETASTVIKEGEALRKLIADGLAATSNPERQRQLQDAAKQADLYAAGFEHMHAMNLEQAKLQTGVLDVAGPQMTDAFTTVITGAVKAGNAELQRLAANGRQLSLTAQLSVNKRLGQHDEAAGKAAEQQFADLTQVLAQLDAATRDTELNATVKSEATLVERYQTAFRSAASLDADQLTLMNGSLRPIAEALSTDANQATDGNLAGQAVAQTEAKAVTGSSQTLVMALGLGALIAGVVLAWLIGRGISGPVMRMCVAMRALAGGDTTVEIPGVGRKDEIGQMADIAAAFKNHMIEADRLRVETEQHKAAAEAERKTGMLRLADGFEAGIKGVVNSVASQATEMQSSAQAMAHTAEQATHQATAVAAAVEEASANVQTVASSAEELSTSVLEIGRQVEQSSKIAGQAVVEADKTNATVEGLNKTAQRIGEVVQLIETIASQTNLPPLRFRISRYISLLRQKAAGFTHTMPIISWS